MSIIVSENFAKVELVSLIIPMILAPTLFTEGRIPLSSELSPLFPIATTTSSAAMIPKSPCIPSAGCINIAGVPTLDIVAAIFLATKPDFPIPVRTTFP